MPLVNVAAKGFKTSVARLLESRSDPNQKDGYDSTSLCCALQSDNALDTVRLLIHHAVDVNERDGLGRSPLHYAVMSPQAKPLIMELARAKADLSQAPSKEGGSLALDALNLGLSHAFSTLFSALLRPVGP